MAESKATEKIEREYIVPLRRRWVNVPQYKRARKAMITLKEFVAKHMKVPNRNLDNVKLDVYLNNELWFRGKTNPPSKIKVKVSKEGDIVRVKLAESPEHVKFLKLKHSKLHKKAEEKKEVKVEDKKVEQKAEAKSEEQKLDEKEKEKATEQQNIKQADAQQKAQKHTSKVKEPKIQRMAMKK